MSWGAIFDWDGVLADTSAHHERSWALLSAETGRPLPPGHFHRGFGMKNDEIISSLLGWTCNPAEIRRLSLRKEQLFRRLARAEGVSPLPGVRAWLRALDRAGVPRIIASSTHRRNIEALLKLTGLDGFRGIVAAEDVRRGKPAPDVFLEAARRLGFPPNLCVVFEDAPAGIAAARAAGMRVVAVATTYSRARLRGADRVVPRLDALTPAAVAALLRRRSGGHGSR